MTKRDAMAIVAMIGIGVLGAGCASSGDGRGAATTDAGSTAADLGLLDPAPIEADSATLYVEGLSCPACATNVDHQLKRVGGVRAVMVNLGDGTVSLSLGGGARPSRADLSRAIHDSGFTLRRIEVPQ